MFHSGSDPRQGNQVPCVPHLGRLPLCFYKPRHGQCLERLSDRDPVLPSASGDQEAWQRGVLFASGQNLARQLMETPANEMTPTKFAEVIEKNLKSASSKTEVHIR